MGTALLILLMALVIHYPRKSGPARIKREGEFDPPKIDVTFNGDYKEEMELDTGASLTQITEKMAKTLNVKKVGDTEFTFADGSKKKWPIGIVDSIEVGGAKEENVIVAINTDSNIKLLGQSFFGKHEVIIKTDVVEFRS
ncbi:MAG: retroviral-like aspartic protease family protein [Stigonema ocellatum SAG 48.90 = DSM 106950]|nr:retroviral-like aspartic protease family protein [Stigonema ocellatum SAG 48.90 = DSM 106950]